MRHDAASLVLELGFERVGRPIQNRSTLILDADRHSVLVSREIIISPT
jgi:hypothetical protein